MRPFSPLCSPNIFRSARLLTRNVPSCIAAHDADLDGLKQGVGEALPPGKFGVGVGKLAERLLEVGFDRAGQIGSGCRLRAPRGPGKGGLKPTRCPPPAQRRVPRPLHSVSSAPAATSGASSQETSHAPAGPFERLAPADKSGHRDRSAGTVRSWSTMTRDEGRR